MKFSLSESMQNLKLKIFLHSFVNMDYPVWFKAYKCKIHDASSIIPVYMYWYQELMRVFSCHILVYDILIIVYLLNRHTGFDLWHESPPLFFSQQAPLDLLVPPQQESAKSTISLLRNLIFSQRFLEAYSFLFCHELPLPSPL